MVLGQEDSPRLVRDRPRFRYDRRRYLRRPTTGALTTSYLQWRGSHPRTHTDARNFLSNGTMARSLASFPAFPLGLFLSRIALRNSESPLSLSPFLIYLAFLVTSLSPELTLLSSCLFSLQLFALFTIPAINTHTLRAWMT